MKAITKSRFVKTDKINSITELRTNEFMLSDNLSLFINYYIIILLTHLFPMHPFYIPSGGRERVHWVQMG